MSLNHIPGGISPQFGIYAGAITNYSYLNGKSNQFDMVKLAANLKDSVKSAVNFNSSIFRH